MKDGSSTPCDSDLSGQSVAFAVATIPGPPHPNVDSPAHSVTRTYRVRRLVLYVHLGSAMFRALCPHAPRPARSRSFARPASLAITAAAPAPRLFCAVFLDDRWVHLPLHGWESVQTMRSHVDAHFAEQHLGEFSILWLRARGFSVCEVCSRVLNIRFNGRCPSCFHAVCPSPALPVVRRPLLRTRCVGCLLVGPSSGAIVSPTGCS